MKKKSVRSFCVGVGSLLVFILWTVAVSIVDIQSIGPQGSSVGFATLNRYVHSLTGVNTCLYSLTDWLSLVPIGIAVGFAVLGVSQWCVRKSLLKVDRSILALGGFYIVVVAVYVLFEIVTVNYRPVLINESLEASYPSSTTMLVMCIMPTAMMQLHTRIKRKKFRRLLMLTMAAFTAFMVIGRFLSGVHWITDIIGGAFFSVGSVMIYHSVSRALEENLYKE